MTKLITSIVLFGMENENNGETKLTRNQKRHAVAKRLLELAKPEYGHIALGLAGLAVNSATNLCFPWILGKAVDHFSVREQGSSRFLYVAGGIFALGSAASWVRVYNLGIATERIAYMLRRMLFDEFMDKDIAYFDSSKTGELVKVLDDDVDLAAEALTAQIAAGLRSVNSSLNGSIMLFTRSPTLTLVSLSIVPLIGIGAMGMNKLVRRSRERLRLLQGDTLNFAIERFTCMSTVKLNGREDYEARCFEHFADECHSVARDLHFVNGAFMSYFGASVNVGLLAVLFKGGSLLAEDQMTSGDLTQFALQSAFVGLGFAGLSRFYSDLCKSLDAAERVFDALDDTRSSSSGGGGVDLLEAPSTGSGESTLVPAPVPARWQGSRGHVELKGVTFAYPTRPTECVIENLSLTIKAGSITAVTGKSGSGKSTLVNIVSGLYRPQQGSVVLDGVSLSPDATLLEDIRQAVGVVEQSANLLSGTIHEAIAYGGGAAFEIDPAVSGAVHTATTLTTDASEAAELLRRSEEQRADELKRRVIAAAKLAGAHNFIVGLPAGYDTPVGSRGKQLSGGQQARVAIARALLREPRLLLLDEATAGLDASAEGELLDILRNLVQGSGSFNCTVLFFTHSPAVCSAADTVHRMSAATRNIVASGSSELVEA